MKRTACLLLLSSLIAAPALAQVPAVRKAGQAVVAQLTQQYDDYQQALVAEETARADEASKYDALVQAQAALDAATAARDAAQADLDAAKAVTDAAHAATDAAYQAVRP